jgi:hypothetical protein
VAIAYVQQTTASATASPATTAAFGSTTVAGQLVVVAVTNDSGSTASLGCTDSLGNTYTRVPLASSGQMLEIWYSILTTGGASHTVSVTWSLADASRCTVVAQSFSGLSGTGNQVDVYASTTGTSTAASSGATSAPTSSSSLVVAAASGASATPSTLTLGPTQTHGLTSAGSTTDSGDSNFLNGTKITTTTGGLLTSISVYVGATVGSNPNNQFQVAIYSDSSGVPGTLIANSSSATLTASALNTASVSAVLAPSTSYWLMYNTNGTASNQNNLKYNTTGTSRISSTGQTFGTWPSTFPSSSSANVTFSIYATLTEFYNIGTVAAAGVNLGLASKTTTSQSGQTATMTLPSSQFFRCSCVVFKEVAGSSPVVTAGTFLVL